MKDRDRLGFWSFAISLGLGLAFLTWFLLAAGPQ